MMLQVMLIVRLFLSQHKRGKGTSPTEVAESALARGRSVIDALLPFQVLHHRKHRHHRHHPLLTIQLLFRYHYQIFHHPIRHQFIHNHHLHIHLHAKGNCHFKTKKKFESPSNNSTNLTLLKHTPPTNSVEEVASSIPSKVC